MNAIKDSKSNIEVDGFNILSDQLKVGQTIFVVFGGDQGKSDVTWDTGLAGIGHIVSEPYNFEGRNYKIKIDVDLLLQRAMKREDLLQYRNAYIIIGISPMEAIVSLNCVVFKDVQKKDRSFTLETEVVGKFSLSLHNSKQIQELCRLNATAILYPYLRAFISNLTALSGVPNLLLPTVNVHKLLEESEKDEQEF
ncbi:hypothetical protein C1I59_00600 [Paenibacillus polymyxa]|uniref:protein-export chaperone SecB n=1 Tax=Paenibacillus polymyxa TaxID=1406 RepID=UPI0010BE2896|nr:protein-export chaperone SecB [Paenibacillus polymyxa]TKH40306.1 hypothetical protein C1I59_00600 [Paenibacillus polymyxa]